MGDQADPDADYAAKVLAFNEDDIEDYASVVKKYFEEGSSMNIKTLQALLRSAGVDRTQGCVGRYTRALVLRDLMAYGVRLSDTVDPVPREIVEAGWMSEDSEDSGGDEEKDQDLDDPPGSPDFADPIAMRKAWKSMHLQVQAMQRTMSMQQLQLQRVSATESVRQYGLGLTDFALLPESKALLWDSATNPYQQKPLKASEFQKLIAGNSSDELSFWQRPGLGETEAAFANKTKEFSVKDVFSKFTSKSLQRLEPPLTTLVSAHSAVLYAADNLSKLAARSASVADGEGRDAVIEIPTPLRKIAQQAEVDLVFAQERVEATTQLLLAEYARLCSDTSASVAKKMSADASEQLSVSRKPASERAASMLTDEFISLLEAQRKQKKSLSHALDSSGGAKGGKAGRGGSGKSKPRGAPGKNRRRNNNNNNPTNKPPKSPSRGPSPAPGAAKRSPGGKGGGK